MSKILSIIIVFASFQASALAIKNGQGKITNPKVSSYTVKMFIGTEGEDVNASMCTGTFISEDTILTAAHCLPALDKLDASLYITTFDGSDVKDIYEVLPDMITYHRYPGYEVAMKYDEDAAYLYDFGLVRFSKPIYFGPAAELYQTQEGEGYPTVTSFEPAAKYFALGAGSKSYWVFDPFKKIKEMVNTFMGPLLGTEIAIAKMDSHIEYVTPKGTQMCQGDSGGPILVQDAKGVRQIGVHSQVYLDHNMLKIGECGNYVLATSINKAKMDWIRETMGNLEETLLPQTDLN